MTKHWLVDARNIAALVVVAGLLACTSSDDADTLGVSSVSSGSDGTESGTHRSTGGDEGGPAGSTGETENGGAGSTTADDSGADTTAAGGSSSDGDTGQASDEVPDNAYCQDYADWDPQWSAMEWEILEIVNTRRTEGANCRSEGQFGPAAPLTMNPALRCAARQHSQDMVERDYFDHVSPSGDSPADRVSSAGYNWTAVGENIAAGNARAAATMAQWMDSDGHCANIMSPDFTEIGVGYFPGGQYGHYWTQAFGHP